MTAVDLASRPGLRLGVRTLLDEVRGQTALLHPEGVLLLNDTAADVVARLDGDRTVADIVADLSWRYDEVPADEVVALLSELVDRRLLWSDGGDGPPGGAEAAVAAGAPTERARIPLPTGLTAELTYRCPLQCSYCSNPLELDAYRNELSTDGWLDVIEQARALGALQIHFSGGEPLLRPDLPQLVRRARDCGMYTNLVTSGIPLSETSLELLTQAGLEHLQLSLQDADQTAADAIAGVRAHERKQAAAALVRRQGLPFTVNVVLHRRNLERLIQIAELAVGLGCDRLELAHTQFYGWALRNRSALLPTPEQVVRADEDVERVRQRFGDRVEIVYVAADYHSGVAKPCMGGWGETQLIVDPTGDVLPCLAAGQIPDLGIRNLREGRLADIWYDSPAFTRFRGTDWMQEPCRSCEFRQLDFGGCRCQAFQLTGDAAATDPACRFSPHHDRLVARTRTDADLATVAVPRRRPSRRRVTT